MDESADNGDIEISESIKEIILVSKKHAQEFVNELVDYSTAKARMSI
jgi:hypothetical protein